jgi:glycogen operon protein
MRDLAPGSPEPLGVRLIKGGANFAVFSAHATAIEVCLFDPSGATELERIRLPERTGDVFHGFVAGIKAGSRYGLRAHGPYDPRAGHRFNAAKLLVDPHATALDRRFALHPAIFGERPDGTRNDDDSAGAVPKAIVTRPVMAAKARRSRVPWESTFAYELHVRGFTRTHPGVPQAIRGTCAGLAHPAALAHLVKLGVTTVELMPVAAAIDEPHLGKRGLTNYWGYNPVGWMVPDPALAPGGIAELAACVRALQEAGLEVLLDVVFNHSGEGDERGPTLSLRGLDNASYYRLQEDRRLYANDAGCGNTLAVERPPALRLVLDTLRHYAQAAGVDGFRFDLAATLGRRGPGFDPEAPLLCAIAQDPVLRELKLVAEPWDIGPGGHRLGAFPANWGEWNDRYRDAARRFWRGDAGMAGEFATRLAGSSDVFAARSRPPSRSVNFICAHDGFTLADLVSHARKHNEVNGEDNRDGSDANFSWNHGAEGASADPAIAAMRRRDAMSLVTILLVSRGTPLISMGDELGRTQNGNNNAYAQDNALTWLDWARADRGLADFVAKLAALRRRHPALRADRWLTGEPMDASGIPDVEWRHPDGRSLAGEEWSRAGALVVALYASQAGAAADRVALGFNPHHEALAVRWPDARDGFRWRRIIDTSLATGSGDATAADAESALAPRSVVVLIEESEGGRRSRRSAVEPALLDRLARAAGIEPEWKDVAGGMHKVSDDTRRALLAAMGLAVASKSEARERLAALALDREHRRKPPLPVAPPRCYLPDALRDGGRRFGLAAHLYALRSPGDQGIGDFSTLERAARATARAGGALVGLNPLHALFPADRERASPYHPSDRRFLDAIYIDLASVPDLARSEAARRILDGSAANLARLSARATVDYSGVWDLKRAVLEACFAAFEARPADDPLARQFARFVSEGGEALARFAQFEAIAAAHPGVPWQAWEPGLRRPDGAGVAEFADRHAGAVRFAMYLQWLADSQLAHAAASSGLEIGLYRDLAVGAAPDGGEAWSRQDALAHGASIGAPPDPFCPTGQVWNLPPPRPDGLSADGFAGYRALIAANMRHAGALRIDHVMGLSRLFWVPDGAQATEGAYVRYPLDGLLGALALESHRARCLVVGEDLGTLPEGFHERLDAAGVLSYRVLWFERDRGTFRPPHHYPAKCAATVSTHDLATIAGWWAGRDIAERVESGAIGGEEEALLRAERDGERKALCAAVEAQDGVPLPREDSTTAAASRTQALHRFIASSPAALVLIQADDLAAEVSALNLPGTDRERPNWRRRASVEVDDLWTTAIGARTAADLAPARGAKRR